MKNKTEINKNILELENNLILHTELGNKNESSLIRRKLKNLKKMNNLFKTLGR